MPNKSRQKTQQKLQQVRDATAKELPATSTLRINGQKTTVPDLLKVLDEALATFPAVDAARGALTSALKGRKPKVSTALLLVLELEAVLRQEWGKQSPLLNAFGFQTKPKRVPTAEQKALAAARAKLTRAARGTKGKKQKLAVTAQGSVGLVLVQPDGTQVPGVLTGPQAPGLATPAVHPQPAGISSSSPESNPAK